MNAQPIDPTVGPNCKVHKFELAGLGSGPYRFLGVTKNWFSAGPGDPGKPGGSCDYCGTGIAFEFWLESTGGKRFKVGSDCIHKTNDKTLIGAIATAEREHRNAVTAAREDARIAAFQAHAEAFFAQFDAQPHPNAFYASQGKTRADYLRFCWSSSGRSGRAKYAKTWLKSITA